MIVRAISTEWIKLTTVRATKWLLVGSSLAAFAITVIAALVIRNVGEQVDHEHIIAPAPFTGFGGLPGIAIIFAGVIGVLSVTTEIRYNTLRTTFLALPNRWIALLAKTIVVALSCAVAYAVAMVISVVVYGVIVHGSPLSVFDSGTAFLITFPVSTAITAILGIAVGSALRNGAGAITALLAYLFVIDNVITSIPRTHDAGHFLPLSNLQNFMGVLMSDDFPWNAVGSLIYLVVVIGALWAAGVALLSRRDA